MWCSTRWPAELLPGLALALALGASAWASPGAPAPAPAPTSPPPIRAAAAGSHAQLPGSRLQGEATLRFFGLRVYHARLWTLPDFRPEQASEQPLVLELEYLRDLNGRAIAERSLKEMQRAGGFTEAQGQAWLAQMQRLFPDVKAGDRIRGLNEPGQGARFWHNGKPIGRVDDDAFARLFFGIWLAPSTSEPEMRQALLGASGAR